MAANHCGGAERDRCNSSPGEREKGGRRVRRVLHLSLVRTQSELPPHHRTNRTTGSTDPATGKYGGGPAVLGLADIDLPRD